MKAGIGFIPQGMYLVVTVPMEEVAPNNKVDLDEKVAKQLLDSKVEEYIKEGKELVVAAAGDGTNFAKVGEKVLIGGNTRLQTITLEGDNENFYYVVRESDILGKLD